MFKKGTFMNYFFIFGFSIGLITFFVFFIKYKAPGPYDYIGQFHLNLLKDIKNSEKTLLYIDQSAKYSAYQTIYDLGKRGGYYEASECGEYLGYNLWKSGQKD
jgi:hypothetical protein